MVEVLHDHLCFLKVGWNGCPTFRGMENLCASPRYEMDLSYLELSAHSLHALKNERAGTLASKSSGTIRESLVERMGLLLFWTVASSSSSAGSRSPSRSISRTLSATRRGEGSSEESARAVSWMGVGTTGKAVETVFASG